MKKILFLTSFSLFMIANLATAQKATPKPITQPQPPVKIVRQVQVKLVSPLDNSQAMIDVCRQSIKLAFSTEKGKAQKGTYDNGSPVLQNGKITGFLFHVSFEFSHEEFSTLPTTVKGQTPTPWSKTIKIVAHSHLSQCGDEGESTVKINGNAEQALILIQLLFLPC